MKRARRIDLVLPPVTRDRSSLWRNLAAAIAWQIDLGRLASGSRLPATRALARRLQVSRNTVALAYEELIDEGYLTARVGDGTYVCAQTQRRRPAVWQRRRRWVRDPDGLLLSIVY
jgi:DNA-binding GntR family transcriptional regulator